MAEEIVGREANKNWTANFVPWHKTELKSLYLCNIDNSRAKSEYAPMIAHFFEVVSHFLFQSLDVVVVSIVGFCCSVCHN